MSKVDQRAASDEERSRSLVEYVRDAWSNALVAVSTAEDEVQRLMGRIGEFVEVGPEEARRLASELTERLLAERDELEQRVEESVRRTLGSVRLPSLEDVSNIDARLDRIEERLERLFAARNG